MSSHQSSSLVGIEARIARACASHIRMTPSFQDTATRSPSGLTSNARQELVVRGCVSLVARILPRRGRPPLEVVEESRHFFPPSRDIVSRGGETGGDAVGTAVIDAVFGRDMGDGRKQRIRN